jgi:flagellar assembly factor FliW
MNTLTSKAPMLIDSMFNAHMALDNVKSSPGIKYIETRFGRIKVDVAKTIIFNQGILGMPEQRKFCLANFPNSDSSKFMILQSLDNVDITFVILPLGDIETASSMIEKSDIIQCSEKNNLPLEDILILLITSVHNCSDGPVNQVKVSVNTRAPLIIDSRNRLGIQHILSNEKYLIQQFIS